MDPTTAHTHYLPDCQDVQYTVSVHGKTYISPHKYVTIYTFKVIYFGEPANEIVCITPAQTTYKQHNTLQHYSVTSESKIFLSFKLHWPTLISGHYRVIYSMRANLLAFFDEEWWACCRYCTLEHTETDTSMTTSVCSTCCSYII